MFDSEIKSIALFFFFAYLDDRRSLLASAKATDLFYKKMKNSPQTKPAVAVVSLTKQVWDKNRKNFQRGHPNVSGDSGWLLPEGIDLSPWKDFQKISTEDEFLAVIWSKILRISDQDISNAIGLSEGTLRYRVGRALRRIGGLA